MRGFRQASPISVISLGAALLALLLTPWSNAQQYYVVTDLGSLEESASEAYGINSYGQVVGRAYSTLGEPGEYPRAFHWQNNEMLDLAGSVHFHHVFNIYRGEMFDISDGDRAVGGGWREIDVGNDTYYYVRGFIFRPSVMTDLTTPLPGDGLTDLGTWVSPTVKIFSNSTATSVSNRNHAVGWADFDANGSFHAFMVVPQNGLWFVDNDGDQVNDLLLDLGSLGGEDGDSSATGVNDNGAVVGFSYTTTGGYQGFFLEPTASLAAGQSHQWSLDENSDGVNDLMRPTGTLGGKNSWARGINNLNQVVGEADTAQGDTRAFLWQDDQIIELGTLGGDDSSASRINDSGEIVGWSEDSAQSVRAFVFRDGEMIDLNTVVLNGVRWRFEQARDINESGEIVGWGTFSSDSGANVRRAFLLRPATAEDIAFYGEPVVETDTPTDATGVAPTGVQILRLDPLFRESDSTTAVAGATEAAEEPSQSLCGVGIAMAIPLVMLLTLGSRGRRVVMPVSRR